MDVFVNLLAVTVRKMEIIIKQYMPEKVLESEKREDVDQIGKYCLQDQNKDDEESTDDEGTSWHIAFFLGAELDPFLSVFGE